MLKWRRGEKKIYVIGIGIAVAGALFYLASDREGPRQVKEAKQLLKSEGLKAGLTEFDFRAPIEVQKRVAALTNQPLRSAPVAREESERRRRVEQLMPWQMVMAGTNSAIVAWREENWLGSEQMALMEAGAAMGSDYWGLLRALMEADWTHLDAARAAAVSGRIRYHLDATKGHSLLLPHLATHKRLVQQFGSAAILELHDGNQDAAWTNILAATRMVTGWDPHPVEISMGVRLACTQQAFPIVWQALQADWTEERLAELQREWEVPDFFKDLPDTVAYSRAGAADLCQQTRNEPVSFGVPVSQLIRSPSLVWSGVLDYRRRKSYRRHGSYEDERNILLHFRDREMAMRKAAKARSWIELKEMAALTNDWTFKSRHSSPVTLVLNMKQLAMAGYQHFGTGSSSKYAGSLLARAAEAEVRRRLIVTAIALERYRLREGVYPELLGELAPDFVAAPPIDFMDGNPLRYQRRENDFLLYSVGLDGTDDGGVLKRAENRGVPMGMRMGGRAGERMDLCWPFAASSEEAASYYQEQVRALRERTSRMEEEHSEWHWNQTSGRQAQMNGMVRNLGSPVYGEVKYRGRAVRDLLQSKAVEFGTERSIEELLTLRRFPTTNEPEIVVFEVPVNYDAATNLGSLELLIDPVGEPEYGAGFMATAYEFSRATNGHAQLTWSTVYETPGKHSIQVILSPHDWEALEGLPEKGGSIEGSLQDFTITNLCQFSPTSVGTRPLIGKTLRVKFQEPAASYAVEFVSADGRRLKRVEGSTSNGVATIEWDLNLEEGMPWTKEFQSVLKIALPESGRTQVVRGP